MKVNLVCSPKNSIKETLYLIDKNGYGTCFIQDDLKGLVGVITDGDLRRAILQGKDLEEPVKNILSKKFVFAKERENLLDIRKKLSDEIKIIPIVNVKNKVVDFIANNKINAIPVASPDLYGNELKYLTDAFLSTWISSSGEYINKFEKKFSSYVNCKYGSLVSNGTVALELALKSFGVQPGQEVILPDFTFAATINSVLNIGATPVLVDIEEDSWCISPEKIKKHINRKTAAIIVVHVYGQPANMEKIMKISNHFNIPIIEDCAEAHGAKFKNKPVGSFGAIGTYSFYANKIITTGEGGICVTNSKTLFKKMAKIKNHGMSENKRYWHEIQGSNYRMTNMQAAIGLAQFERVELMLKIRKKYENTYKKIFRDKGLKISFQKNLKDRKRVVWLACGTMENSFSREKLFKKLVNKGIDTRKVFYSLSDMPIFKKYSPEECKVSKDISSRGISFPTFNNELRLDNIKQSLVKNF